MAFRRADLAMGSEHLPFLLKLLDDDSPVVRAEVDSALEQLGPGLAEELERLEVAGPQRELIHQRLLGWRSRHLLEQWPRSWEPSPDLAGLEHSQSLISEFFQGCRGTARLSEQLSALAADYQGPPEPVPLARFLFAERLLGDSVDYYHPLNSSLLHVLSRGRGNPISLACVFMLVGQRVGVEVVGYNAPSHFLALSRDSLFDCFRNGSIAPGPVSPELSAPTAHQVMIRVLRNLQGAHLRLEQRECAQLFGYLLADMQARRPGEVRALWPEPRFWPGQLVRQRDSEYRGVVVHYDLEPDQPRYVVLVHRSSRTQEAQEEQLRADDSGPVAHPFVNYFFSKFEGGSYHRNGRPWEG